MKKLVLLSGGMDSATCLSKLCYESSKPSEEIVTLSITYGQKHTKELECAKQLSEFYNVQHIIKDLTEVFTLSNCSLLNHSERLIPLKSYSEQIEETKGQEAVSTYVPFRNGLFISCAASIALALNCDEIYCAMHSDDAAGFAYPDCSFNFAESMNKAIYEGSGKKLSLVTPFVYFTKKQIAELGKSLNTPYELTWSCYVGGDKPCGKCGTCIDRENALK